MLCAVNDMSEHYDMKLFHVIDIHGQSTCTYSWVL